MRDASDAAVRKVVAIDIGNAFGIRNEVEASAVGREMRIDILRAAEERQHLDSTRRQIDCSYVHAEELQLGEIALAAIGNEGQHFPVGRKGRLHVGVAIVRQAADLF